MLIQKNCKAFRLTIRDPTISEMEETCYSYIWGEEKQPNGTSVSIHDKNEVGPPSILYCDIFSHNDRS